MPIHTPSARQDDFLACIRLGTRSYGFVFRALQALGFVDVDQAVAVGVEATKVLRRAQELAARNVAVAVAVHLAEPQRAACGWLVFRRHGVPAPHLPSK